MNSLRLVLMLASVLAIVSGQFPLTAAIPTEVRPLNKGVTFQATLWPSYETNWAGRFSCNDCNPFQGDVPCTKALPILCLVHHKVAQRPYYHIAIEYTPFAVKDGGYYDSWTGGVFAVTLPVRGSDITDYTVGDNLCKGYFGKNAKFAQFDDGFYMDYMNQRPFKSWWLWDWNKTKRGGWNFWGYFNHHYRGRAWVHVKNQPNGNC